MKKRVLELFRLSSAVLLLVTAIAKLISVTGTATYLENKDPILGISFRALLLFAGVIELAVAFFCFFGSRANLQMWAIAGLSSTFLIYRLSLMWIGYKKTCNCLGNLTDALNLSPEVADLLIKGLLAYLLVGSYTAIFWMRKNSAKFVPPFGDGGAQPEKSASI